MQDETHKILKEINNERYLTEIFRRTCKNFLKCINREELI